MEDEKLTDDERKDLYERKQNIKTLKAENAGWKDQHDTDMDKLHDLECVVEARAKELTDARAEIARLNAALKLYVAPDEHDAIVMENEQLQAKLAEAEKTIASWCGMMRGDDYINNDDLRKLRDVLTNEHPAAPGNGDENDETK